MATSSGLFKFVLCALRRLRIRDDGKNSFIAGLVSGLSLFIVSEHPHTRMIFALYTLARAMKIYVDVQITKGNLKQNTFDSVFWILSFAVSVFYTFIFICDYKLQNEDRYFYLPLVFSKTKHAPNENILSNLYRILCQV